MRGARVQLERRLDGSRWLRWRRQGVALEACERRPAGPDQPRQPRATLGKSAQEKVRGFHIDVRGARDSNHPLPLARTPIPLQKRNFLLCGEAEVSILR